MVLKNKIVFALLGFLLAAVVTLGIGNAVSASGIENSTQTTATTTAHFSPHGPNYCHYYQYWGGRWWGPVSRPYGMSATATVYWNGTSLYQCA